MKTENQIPTAEYLADREIGQIIKGFLDRGLDLKALGESLIVAGAVIDAEHAGPRQTAEFLQLAARKITAKLRS
jgi:hypothetical protein